MRKTPILLASAIALAACSGAEETADEPAANIASEAAPVSGDDAVATKGANTEDSASEATTAVEAEAPAPQLAPTESAERAESKPVKTEPTVEPAKVAAAAPAAFSRCVICHSADKGGADKLGPNLWGTYGSKAGQGRFAFSPALKNSGLTWTDANLDAWLENPRMLVPNNRMAFPGLKDAKMRQEIIAYLKQQR